MHNHAVPKPDSTYPDTTSPRQRHKAVFFTYLSVTTGRMIEAWLSAGHEIGAIVVYRQKRRRFLANPIRWLALEKSLMRHVRRHRIPVIELIPPVDWEALGQTLSSRAADIAITFGFMRLVPQGLLARFRHGGVNFHPALLPHYRGPQPNHWLAIDGTWDRFGGVTLHQMTDRFDEGAILAQAPVSLQVGAEDLSPSEFAASAVVCMTRDVIARYCMDEIPVWQQPPGDYPYAGGDFPDLVVQGHWTRDHLKRLCTVITKKPGVIIKVAGKSIRLLGEARVLGPPSGKPAKAHWGRIEFDLADCRVVYWRHSPLSKRLQHFRDSLRELNKSTHDVQIRLGPFDGVSGQASTARQGSRPVSILRR